MQRKPKKFGNRYPWRIWFAKTRFKLVRGKHYTDRSFIMAQMIRNAARLGRGGLEKGTSVRIKISEDENELIVTVLKGPYANPKVETSGPSDSQAGHSPDTLFGH